MVYEKNEKPQRLQSDKLIVEELPDELMIYDPARNKAFCLNQTAAFVWKRADGETTVEQLATLMGEELKRPANEQAVWFALDVLSKDGLLAPSTILPKLSAGVTRRALLQKFGVGATVVMPLVTVLLASPPKAHASSSKRSSWRDKWDERGYGKADGPWNKDGHENHNSGFWGFLSSLF